MIQKIFCLVFCYLLILAISMAQGAPFLACEQPTAGVVISQVKVEYVTVDNAGNPTGIVTEKTGSYVLVGNNVILLDLLSFVNGRYRFRAAWADNTGWWSDYSDPFVAGKQAKPGVLKIVP
mgnify:CR=1 FL=1